MIRDLTINRSYCGRTVHPVEESDDISERPPGCFSCHYAANFGIPDEVKPLPPVSKRTIEWLNDHPDEAVKLLPEVERYLRWRNSPFTAHFEGEPKYDHSPRRFTTRLGEEVV